MTNAKPQPKQTPWQDASCEQVQQWVRSFVDDPLSLSDLQYLKMQAHLGIAASQVGCPECQKLYLELKRKPRES